MLRHANEHIAFSFVHGAGVAHFRQSFEEIDAKVKALFKKETVKYRQLFREAYIVVIWPIHRVSGESRL